ncbi:MAG: HNH endonuclease [Coriobacteriia bacterium]|nr:HNH endonuclease [Coriobacteriia bacterium]
MPGTYVLPAWHQDVLEWFERNAGRTFAKRPFDAGLPVKLTSAQKGIWKSALSPYAISVVQTPKGVYADQDPIRHPDDGTWRYFYHQQGQTSADIADPQSIFANAALFKCMSDGVPVGVVIPAESGDGYQVLGLAFVEGHSQGYFELVGPVSVGASAELHAAESSSHSAALIGFPIEDFDPNATQDNRLKVIAEVRRRQGGARFRRALLTAYGARCAMTRYDAAPALEAAHILPYRGPQTNHVANGLLLRADMHDLFDLGLIAVDTGTMTLLLANDLAGTEYEKYAGRQLWLPREADARPNADALDKHRDQSLVA